jgi:hypothetical protein
MCVCVCVCVDTYAYVCITLDKIIIFTDLMPHNDVLWMKIFEKTAKNIQFRPLLQIATLAVE